jgi:Asp/Glu/hydantoin racemase
VVEDRQRRLRIVIVGPGVEPPDGLPADVLDDLARLSGPDVDVQYRCVGGGPSTIRSDDDAEAVAPFVVAAAERAAADGFDAVIVDCTDDPGVAEARRRVGLRVVGAGEALRTAIERVDGPVVIWTGDVLRGTGIAQLLADVPAGATVAFGGTGWSHLAATVEAAGHAVIDPLQAAVDTCRDHRRPTWT